VPGHAIGHMSGLIRTTPETFVFLGGDVCHFGGSHRPTAFNLMPAMIPSGTPPDGPFRAPCACSIFTACHPDQANARTSTYYKVSENKGSWYIYPEVAQESIYRMTEFDADENDFVCTAHDPALIPICDWFPNGTLNDWKKKGWKQKSMWGFLNEMPKDGKPSRGWLANGLAVNGVVKRVRG
jgi:hypothetical protein